MGANAQTSVPAFTSGQVLTAAQVTQINTGIPVFASSTERDAAFGGTNEKTLAEGQMAYLEDTNATQYYDGSSWAAVAGGLVHISRTTIGSAVSSVTVTDAFSSTFENYRIVGYIDSASAASAGYMQLGVGGSMTSTGYYWGHINVTTGGTVAGVGGSNATGIENITVVDVNGGSFVIDVMGPNLARRTNVTSAGSDLRTAFSPFRYTGGFADNNTQFTSFRLYNGSGTFTGGTIDVYGYAGA